MMLATWLVEFYLSKCNELDDLVASESVSQDVDNLLAERAILEDDLQHFFETYKVWRLIVDIERYTDPRRTGEPRFADRIRADPRSWADGHVPPLCHGDRRLRTRS